MRLAANLVYAHLLPPHDSECGGECAAECRAQQFEWQLEAPLVFEMAKEKRFQERGAALLRGEIPA